MRRLSAASEPPTAAASWHVAMTMQHDTQRETPSKTTTVSTTQARAGETGHNVRYVLAVGLAAVIVALGVVYLTYFS
jgi:hypothetical protein